MEGPLWQGGWLRGRRGQWSEYASLKDVQGHPLATSTFGSSHRPGPSGPGAGQEAETRSGEGGTVHVNLGKMVELVGIFDVVG